MVKNNEIKLKQNSITKLYLQGCKRNWLMAIIVAVFMSVVAFCTVFNIKIAQQLVLILSAQNMLDIMTNNNGILDNLLQEIGVEATIPWGSDWLYLYPKEITQIFRGLGIEAVYMLDGKINTDLFGFDFTMTSWIIYLICNIGAIVVTMYIAYLANGMIAQSIETKLRKDTVNNIIIKDIHYFNKNKLGSLISTIVRDIQFIGDQLKVAPIILIYIVLGSMGTSYFLTLIDWKIALCTLGLIGSIVAIAIIVIFLIKKPLKNINEYEKNLNNKISERIQLIRLVKSSGTWNEEKADLEHEYNVLDKSKKKSVALITIIAALLIGGIGSLTMASIIFGQFMYQGQTTKLLTIFSTFTAGVFVLVTPMFQLKEIFEGANRTKNALINISNIENEPVSINSNSVETINDFEGKIKFEKVSFAYPDELDNEIISDLDLEFEKDKKYAFVGPSGCGKSTIAKLLLRFYDPTKGKIMIDNKHELKTSNLKSWLSNIGYVDQEPQILSGTFIQNIAYGLENWTMEELVEAAKKAKLHNLIMSMPEGYDTVLYEKGSQLSGGQKQRLVIARIFLKNPKILILDEATSALDNIVESEIQAELDKLMVGRTTISIAHRLSTIKDFDKIFVLEPHKGITDIGTFDKLISKPGMFKTLYDLSN